MPLFRPTDFLFTENTEEALERLKSGGKRAHVIAGGTGFYELARRGFVPEVKELVSLMKLGLSYVNDGQSVSIGATTQLQILLESGVCDKYGLEAIGDALREIRPLQIRNVATIGGEICISVPVVDLPTALLACGATIKIASPGNSDRSSELENFYIDAFLTELNYGEIVKEVAIPKKNQGEHSAFAKIGRTAYDFNLVNAAVSLWTRSDGKIGSIRVFLGGIKRTPLHALNFEKKLIGKRPDERIIIEAAEDVFEKEKLLPSVHGSSEYKKALVPVILRDCILKALQRTSS